jgi:hypothetical protein
MIGMGPVGLVRALVVAVAFAEEHQRHQARADHEGQNRAEAERDPAMHTDLDVADRVPRPPAGGRSQDQQAKQNDESERRAHVTRLCCVANEHKETRGR